MWPLLPLHWGLVDRVINISGVEPTGKILEPIKGEDAVQALSATALVKKVSGTGSVSGIRGSGSTKNVGGRGRLCP